MTTLDRYLLREITIPLIVGLGLFLVVLVFAQILQISDAVTGLGISGSDMLQALAYSLPPLLGLLLPVSMLFATLLAIGRLSSDREVVAMCAAGLSPYGLLRVPLGVGLVLCLGSGIAMAYGESWGIKGLRDLMSRSAQRTLAAGVRPGEFHEWLPGVTFTSGARVDGVMQDVIFSDERDPEKPIFVSAKRGAVLEGERARDLVFDLRDGTIVVRERDGGARRIVHFERTLYRLDVHGLIGNKGKTLSPVQELDLATLIEEKETHPKANRRAHLEVVLHRRFAIPLATLIFAMLAVPLACSRTGGARARGFLYSAALVGAYYYVGRVAELMARAGKFNPVLAAWLPNAAALVAMSVLLWRFRRRAV